MKLEEKVNSFTDPLIIKHANMECKTNNTGRWRDDWDFVISAAITSSFGGAVLGGSLFNMKGALIGGAVGIFVEIWPFLRLKNSQTQNKS